VLLEVHGGGKPISYVFYLLSYVLHLLCLHFTSVLFTVMPAEVKTVLKSDIRGDAMDMDMERPSLQAVLEVLQVHGVSVDSHVLQVCHMVPRFPCSHVPLFPCSPVPRFPGSPVRG
jgi:hypothetical protein